MSELPSIQLPWLARHGDVIGYGLWLAVILVGVALYWIGGAWHARRRAARERSRLGVPLDDPVAHEPGEPAVLEGRLRLLAGACKRFEDGAKTAASTAGGSLRPHWASLRLPRRQRDKLGIDTVTPPLETVRADGLSVVVGEIEVLLEGPLEVRAGSREHWPGRKRGRPDAQPAAYPVNRSLADGDRVRVAGKLFGESGERERGYRKEAKQWVLRPAGVHLQVVFAGQPRFVAPLRGLVKFAALPAALLGLALLYLGGKLARGPLDDDVVASVSPFERDAAIRWLEHLAQRQLHEAKQELERATLRDRASLERLLTVYRRLHDCPAEAWRLASHRQYRAAAARFTSCHAWCREGLGDALATLRESDDSTRAERLAGACNGEELPLGAAASWVMAGELERASDLLKGRQIEDCAMRLFAARTHLLAKRLEPAAEAMSAYADCAKEIFWKENRYAAIARGQARCVAAALCYRAGERGVIERIVDAGAEVSCKLIRADVLEGVERLAALEDLEPSDQRDRWLAILLAIEAGRGDVARTEWLRPGPVFSQTSTPVALLTLDMRDDQPRALARAVLHALAAEPAPPTPRRMLRAQLAFSAAIRALHRGDRAGAILWADQFGHDLARAHVDEGKASDLLDGLLVHAQHPLLRAAIAIRFGEPAEAHRWLDTVAGGDMLAEWSLAGVYRADMAATLQRMIRQLASLATYQQRGSMDGIDDLFEFPGLASYGYNSLENWARIAAADGETIAALGCQRNACGVGESLPILLAAGRIESGRSAVVEAFRYRPFESWSGGTPPLFPRRSLEAAYVATIARILGDEALAREEEAAARRLEQAAMWRPVAVPMYLMREDQ